MRNIFNSLRSFPDSKTFARNQFQADLLVINTIPGRHKEFERVRAELEEKHGQKQNILDTNSEFLNENGFIPSYTTEKRSRQFILFSTPIFSGLSIATGLNIIFGLNIVVSIIVGLSLSAASFFLALNDKVLEGLSTNKKGLTYLLFLALDAVILFVGLFIGLSSGIPNVYMVIHVLLCVFAVSLNYCMLKHADKYNEDKIRKRIKLQYTKVKDLELNFVNKLEGLRIELQKLLTDLGTLAVSIREGFVVHNYDPSTIRMSEETRMVLNQYFGYDLFPIAGDNILPSGFEWNRRQRTIWPEGTSSLFPEVLVDFGHFSSRSRFISNMNLIESSSRVGALNDANRPFERSNNDPNSSNSTNRPQVNNQTNFTDVNNTISVNQTAESENEL